MRNLTLDYLKIVLAACVVGIHANFLHDVNPNISHFLTSYLFRLAVPLFFMINGFYFLRILIQPQKFLAWFLRILGLYLIWMALYWPFYKFSLHKPIDYGLTFLIGFYHLWYVIATLCCGLIFMILRKLPDKGMIALLVLCFVTGLSLQYLGAYHVFHGTKLDSTLNYFPVYRNALSFGLPFFGSGVFIAKFNLSAKIKTKSVYMAMAFGFALMVCEYGLHQLSHQNQGFDILLSLPFAAMPLFIWAMQSKAIFSSAIPNELSSLIYFMHPIWLKYLGIWGVKSESLIVPVAIGACLIAAVVLIPINRLLGKYLKFGFI